MLLPILRRLRTAKLLKEIIAWIVMEGGIVRI